MEKKGSKHANKYDGRKKKMYRWKLKIYKCIIESFPKHYKLKEKFGNPNKSLENFKPSLFSNYSAISGCRFLLIDVFGGVCMCSECAAQYKCYVFIRINGIIFCSPPPP